MALDSIRSGLNGEPLETEPEEQEVISMAEDKEIKKEETKELDREKSDADTRCCYVVDACGCAVDPCGCYVDPCCCC